ncbi:MAG: hypothetical protein EAZ53_13765 [Bacteroidetes bacterium]|nr:MAG: hypothetical protein EAZ53_13765 [Bacteroidota bacterium]
MNIKEIHINAFKAFQYKKFDFNKGFNVIIGNNATGKSTIFNALQVSLGGYLKCINLPSSTKTRRDFKKDEVHKDFNSYIKGLVVFKTPTLILTTADFPCLQKFNVEWRRMYKNNTTSQNQKDSGYFNDIIKNIIEKYENGRLTLPIIASYGTERTQKIEIKGKKTKSKKTIFEKAYSGCLSEKIDFENVLEWLYYYEEELAYNKEFIGTKYAFFEAIQTAIPFLKNVDYDRYSNQLTGEINIENVEKEKILHEYMSDGLKAMLYMVADIAFRCVILNGFKGKNAVKETEGIILIDELDMHLHPNWQRQVVDDFKKSFPKLQFIVTTHSPFIVQSLTNEELINLEIQSQINPKEYSIEVVSEEIMNVSHVFGNEKIAEEKLSIDYFELLNEAEKSENKNDYRIKLEQLENSITDDGLRAFWKTNRIAKNLI